MAHCDTSVKPDSSLWEGQKSAKQIFSIIKGRILVGMITTLVRHSNLHTVTAHSLMWWTQIRHTAIGATGEINVSEKEGWLKLVKVMMDHSTLSEGHENSSKCYQKPYADINIDFHQLRCKAIALLRWFHTIAGRQCNRAHCFPLLSLSLRIYRYITRYSTSE